MLFAGGGVEHASVSHAQQKAIKGDNALALWLDDKGVDLRFRHIAGGKGGKRLDGSGYPAGLKGTETFDIEGIAQIQPGQKVTVKVHTDAGDKTITVLCRIDTPNEIEYFKHGGILRYVLRQAIAK
ncbi:MAG: hypothetical protein EBX37_08745 [Alphaproteobacteria bacterium]|nr:hypothetical protein [Alphaproteobacteria bacterium]